MKNAERQAQAIFHGRTYIATRQGWRRVEALEPGHEIYTQEGSKPVEQITVKPNTRFYEISLADGALFQGAAEQLVLVTVSGVCRTAEVAALQIGDAVCIRPAFLPQEEVIGKPTRLSDRKFGFAAGVFFASGGRCPEGMVKQVAPQNQGPAGASWAAYLQKEFLCVYESIAPIGSPSVAGTAGKPLSPPAATLLFQWLLSKLGDDSRQATAIPETWMNGNPAFTAGFLDGYFSVRGTIHADTRKPCLLASTPSEQFARQLRLILLSVGVHTRISRSQRMRRDRAGQVSSIQQPMCSVSIAGQNLDRFHAVVSLSCVEKHQDFLRAMSHSRNFPDNWSSEVVSVRRAEAGNGYQLMAEGLSEYITDGGVACAKAVFLE